MMQRHLSKVSQPRTSFVVKSKIPGSSSNSNIRRRLVSGSIEHGKTCYIYFDKIAKPSAGNRPQGVNNLGL